MIIEISEQLLKRVIAALECAGHMEAAQTQAPSLVDHTQTQEWKDALMLKYLLKREKIRQRVDRQDAKKLYGKDWGKP